ncbi:conserved unknown protein [Ectocarpus siliculosus]|uniref:Uncharacterized protein n=1 Tax=Ectocarpus siliculosus TaxID=2880 RepID=D7FTZ2_ECTSI|nr:conserved unknown protein [Ectocarpus siliculosus]|eukprot:CBJ31519.1 conserved unknown protein [Ectocarpus siliculosus]
MLAFPGGLAWVGHEQVQTQELATALVQALLNDQEVVRAGALFLREASANPETQAALVSLALYVLQHPDTRAETKVLAKKLIKAILDDPDTVLQVTDMVLKVIRTPQFRQGASELVVALGQSQEVYGAVVDLASRVIQDPKVQATLSTVLSASSREVLQDQVVFDHSKVFVAQVWQGRTILFSLTKSRVKQIFTATWMYRGIPGGTFCDCIFGSDACCGPHTNARCSSPQHRR